jgi:hypothetical protein
MNSFNINIPSLIEFERIEILNMSYTIDGQTIPTFIYFDGYLAANDYLEVVAYNEAMEELDKVSSITNLSSPVIFNGLPADEDVTFKYFINHRGNIMDEKTYKSSLATPEEYLNIKYTYYYANPGDVLITYNDDFTYNGYVYTGFEHNSNYDLIHKVELADGMIPKYEYIGTDKVAEITQIEPNEYLSLVQKVMVKDGEKYYVIGNFYLASGTVGFDYIEGEPLDYFLGEIYSNEDKTYTISSYLKTDDMAEVEVTLSTSEVLNFEFLASELYDGKIIDLTDYEYDSLQIKVKVLANPFYGDGDRILETGITVKGRLYLELEEEYIE